MKLQVRLADERDTENLVKWLSSTEKNLFDPDIAKYPNLRILAVEDETGKVLVYLPFHVVIQGESLAINPDTDKKELGYAFRQLDTELRSVGSAYGIKELYFQCAEESFIKFAERHGWTEVKHKYLRSKIKDTNEATSHN